MPEIVIFDPSESRVVEGALRFASRRNPDYQRCLLSAKQALETIAESISRYPSVTSTQTLRKSSRSVETLVQSLCEGSANDRALQTPTRAVLGKSFLIAKVHFLYLIRDMYGQHALQRHRAGLLTDLIFANVFTLMSEDVFTCILEDRRSDAELRRRAAEQLAHIWEWRLRRNVQEFAPVLSGLWQSRRTLRPIYGTMLGASELLQLAARAHPRWFDFLQANAHRAEACQALEEFLFDLTHEQLLVLRSEMDRRCLAAVRRKDVAAILGSAAAAPEPGALDPRWMYASFQRRRTDAQFRVRAALPGPTQTVEELLMGYLLQRDGAPS